MSAHWPQPRPPTIDERLDRIMAIVQVTQADVRVLRIALTQVLKLEAHQMATMQDLLDAASKQTTVEESLEALLHTIAADLKAALAANDPAALQQVLDLVEGNTARMAAAVVENTPAAPTP